MPSKKAPRLSKRPTLPLVLNSIKLSEMSHPPPLPHHSKRRMMLLIVLGLVLAPVVGVLAWHLTWRFSSARAVRQLEDRARQRGEPLTLSELALKYPPIPDEQNAAVALLNLWEEDQPEYWKAFRRGERNLSERQRSRFDPALPFLGSEAKRP